MRMCGLFMHLPLKMDNCFFLNSVEQGRNKPPLASPVLEVDFSPGQMVKTLVMKTSQVVMIMTNPPLRFRRIASTASAISGGHFGAARGPYQAKQGASSDRSLRVETYIPCRTSLIRLL